MIDIKELRIGNYIVRISNPNEILTVDIDLFIKVSRQPFLFKPIKLTDDLKVKLGFEYKEWISYSDSDMFKSGGEKVNGHILDNIWGFINYEYENKIYTWFGRRVLHPLAHHGKHNEEYLNKWTLIQHGRTPEYVHQIQNIYFELTRGGELIFI